MYSINIVNLKSEVLAMSRQEISFKERIEHNVNARIKTEQDIHHIKKCISGDYGAFVLSNTIDSFIPHEDDNASFRWRSQILLYTIANCLVDIKAADNITLSEIRNCLRFKRFVLLSDNELLSNSSIEMIDNYLTNLQGFNWSDSIEGDNPASNNFTYQAMLYFDLLDVLEDYLK